MHHPCAGRGRREPTDAGHGRGAQLPGREERREAGRETGPARDGGIRGERGQRRGERGEGRGGGLTHVGRGPGRGQSGVARQHTGHRGDGVERALAMNAGRSAEEIAARSRTLFDEDARRARYAEAYARALGGTTGPDVDVIIAVHDPRRRIDRAVGSVLTSRAVSRVIVVCPGVDPVEIEATARTTDARVEFVRFDDGVRSPAGPFNHGLDLATGRYVMIMGSDDELTPGAVDEWRRGPGERGDGRSADTRGLVDQRTGVGVADQTEQP